ncbi:MAG: response regulator transcription factor [Thermoflexales bacterium]
MIRILLADDHAVLRAGLRMLLESQPDLKVVGEAGTGLEALGQVQTLQPDVILLDLTMPGMGGMEALPALRKLAPAARVLVLTMHDDEGYLRRALRGGASGYVLKRAADSELLSAVRAVARGEVYVHPSMTRALLSNLVEDAGSAAGPGANDPWASLSEREYEVLKRVARGHTNAEIAEQLSLSVKTVETYRARGMEKLDLRTRAQLLQAALAKGLLE